VRTLKYFDLISLGVILFLTLFGIVMIYSAGFSQGGNYWLKQLIFLIFSLGIFVFILFWKLKFWFSRSLLFYFMVIALLVFQLFFGRYIAGTRAWLRFGPLGLQVSEFVKIFLALALAKFLTGIERIGWLEFAKITLLIALPMGLIILQPDFGIALTLAAFVVVLPFLKPVRKSIIAVALLIFLAGGYFAWNHFLRPYQKSRIISFLKPEMDKSKSGYQVWQSKIALGSGGLFGRGYLQGTQSQFQFLPVRHNDFILALVGEELGFFWISMLLFAFMLLFYRQLFFHYGEDEQFYFVIIFNFLIFFQLVINTLMVAGFFPVIGIPVPFVSYGGSSLLSFFIGEAIIFKIKFMANATFY
jgi:rod shape determining protein RodA